MTPGIYSDSKVKYDEMLETYLEPPKVYKLDVVKEHIISSHQIAREISTVAGAPININEELFDYSNEQGLSLDPFALAENWSENVDTQGNVFYFNDLTKEVSTERPVIWQNKKDALSKLTLRWPYNLGALYSIMRVLTCMYLQARRTGICL